MGYFLLKAITSCLCSCENAKSPRMHTYKEKLQSTSKKVKVQGSRCYKISSTIALLGSTEKPYCYQNPKKHFLRIKEENEEKNDETGEEVVGLVIQQVVDDPVEPSLCIVDVRNLEP